MTTGYTARHITEHDMPSNGLIILHTLLNHIILTITLEERRYYTHFTNKKTEAKRN